MSKGSKGLHEGIIYLAGPYSHPDSEVRASRYRMITATAANLVSQGLVVFSPITMTHPLDEILAGSQETLGSEFWVKFDESFMAFCSSMAVLTLDGWDKSTGVAREIEFFRSRNKPIRYLDEHGNFKEMESYSHAY